MLEVVTSFLPFPQGDLQPGQQAICEIYPHGRRGLEARNVRLADQSTNFKPPDMDDHEYREILARRKYDEEVSQRCDEEVS